MTYRKESPQPYCSYRVFDLKKLLENDYQQLVKVTLMRGNKYIFVIHLQ
jgi:hypothetical protein